MKAHIWTRVAAAAAIAIAACLTACTPQSDPPPTSASSATSTTPTTSSATSAPSTPSVDPSTAAAEQGILDAYRGYWDAKVASFADPTAAPDPDLEHYAIDKARSDAESTLLSLRQSGIAFKGEPVLTPAISDVVLEDPSTATVTDCVDVTDWQPYYVETGKSAAAPDQADRVLTVSTAYVYDGHWTIRSSEVDRESSC